MRNMATVNSQNICWHNPPTLLHSLLVENVLWTESPSFVLRASNTFVFLPTSEKLFPPLCVVVAVASILPLSLCHLVFCVAIDLSWGRAVPLKRNVRSRLGLRKVTLSPPASWGKVNLNTPVFTYVSVGLHVDHYQLVGAFRGTGIILHSALWNSLPGSCWMPRLLLWH